MFEKTGEFLKRQFTNAFHTVTKSLSSFLPLLLSILLIESVLFTVFLAFDNNIRTQTESVEETYDYHLTASGLSNVEMATLYRYAARSETAEGHYVIKSEENGVLYIKLLTGNKNDLPLFTDDSLEANYRGMLSEITFDLEPHVSLSPLYLLEDDVASLAFSRNITLLLLSVFLIILFTSFYSIHLNNEKFTYGIYAAFGGKTARLVLNASCELFVCSAFALLPAYYVSAFLCRAMYARGGTSFDFAVFKLGGWLAILLIMIPIIVVSVAFSVKRISFSEPMCLIDAQDNSNLVRSPSGSFNLLKRSFPFGYELLSAWRFRKHYISLALTTALLCVAFVLGFFSSATYAKDADIRHRTGYDFSVQLNFTNTSVLPDSIAQKFAKINGVATAHKEYSTADASLLAHLLFIDAKDVLSGAGLALDEQNAVYYAGNVNYISTTGQDTVDLLKETYTINGDPDALYESDRNILIGSTFRNQNAFRFEVGDTVSLGVMKTDEDGNLVRREGSTITNEELSGRELWMQQYQSFEYELESFTVVGIIEDYPSASEGIPIVFTQDTFERYSETKVTANTLHITAEESLSLKQLIALEKTLNSEAKSLAPKSFLVMTSADAFSGKMEQLFSYRELICVLSLFLLVFIPLHWFYSQGLFFKRRREEFYALHSISAPLGRIRAMFVCDCILMFPIGLFSAGLSLGLSLLAQWLFSFVLPNFFQTDGLVVAEVSLPSWIYILCIALTFLSCVFSAIAPYASYRKEYWKSFKAEELE